jgi:hypothetical protein
MGRPLKISKLVKDNGNILERKGFGYPQIGTLTAAVTPTGLTADEFYGAVGGQIRAAGDAEPSEFAEFPVISVRIRVAGESEDDGFVVRQKGSRKYLVEDTDGNVGVCVLVDKANGALAEGEMTITVLLDDSTEVRLKKLTNKYATDWSMEPDTKVYFVNMFSGAEGEEVVKAGAFNNGTLEIVRVETAVAI